MVGPLATDRYGWSLATDRYGWSLATDRYGWSLATDHYGCSLAIDHYGWSLATYHYGWSLATYRYGWSLATYLYGWSLATYRYGWSLATYRYGWSLATDRYGWSSSYISLWLLLMEVVLAEMTELPDDLSGGAEEVNTDQLAISQANLAFIADDVKKECNLILKLKSPESTDQEVTGVNIIVRVGSFIVIQDKWVIQDSYIMLLLYKYSS
ncbi:hypothetical protein Btru_022155 [Bulinus truncatus]|nr:hypothetical protein Btru_022155 [Bulinus truncatus]